MPFPAVLRRRATYEDLLAVPGTLVAEILDGELYTSPRPAIPHAVAATRLGVQLGGAFDVGRGKSATWFLLDEPELHFGADVVVPDLVGWRRTRLPEPPTGAYITVPPDWVCEVVSPSTERIDRGKKLAIYARVGVQHLWLLNPTSTTIEAYNLEGGRWLLAETFVGDCVVRARPFDEVALDLSGLWITPASQTAASVVR